MKRVVSGTLKRPNQNNSNDRNNYDGFYSQLAQLMADLYEGEGNVRLDEDYVVDFLVDHMDWLIDDDPDWDYPEDWRSAVIDWTYDHFEDPRIVGRLYY